MNPYLSVKLLKSLTLRQYDGTLFRIELIIFSESQIFYLRIAFRVRVLQRRTGLSSKKNSLIFLDKIKLKIILQSKKLEESESDWHF